MSVHSLLKIIQLCAPFAELDVNTLTTIEQDVTHLVNKGTQNVFTTAVECLCTICLDCSKNLSRVSKILLMCTGMITIDY